MCVLRLRTCVCARVPLTHVVKAYHAFPLSHWVRQYQKGNSLSCICYCIPFSKSSQPRMLCDTPLDSLTIWESAMCPHSLIDWNRYRKWMTPFKGMLKLLTLGCWVMLFVFRGGVGIGKCQCVLATVINHYKPARMCVVLLLLLWSNCFNAGELLWHRKK